jgi:carbon monoxide dehydrogenase subunit G
MPEVERSTVIQLDLQTVWPFVADMNQWAADIPGYCHHTTLSERESLWRIKGDVGMLSREADLRVLITEWSEPSCVRFTLEGTEEPISGTGTFTTQAQDLDNTTLGFALTLNAGGPLAPVINVLLNTQLERIVDTFVATLTSHLLENARTGAQG